MGKEEDVYLFENKKKAQVWIETVIYTLIALTLIGLVLAFVIPQVGQVQDRTIIEQSIGVLQDINTLVNSVAQGGAGNKRVMNMAIKKGSLVIDSVNNQVYFQMQTNLVYTEIGQNVSIGDITARTIPFGSLNNVTLIENFSNYNITYTGQEILGTITQSSTPYKLIIQNNGTDSNNKPVIDIGLG